MESKDAILLLKNGSEAEVITLLKTFSEKVCDTKVEAVAL